MILIAAMTQDRIIGKECGLPWNIPEEYRHFLAIITGQTIIAGRKSYEIFGKDLTSAHDIVISRGQPAIPHVTICASMTEAVATAKRWQKEVFCIGGAEIYQLALPLADKMYLSMIKRDYPGDTRFPPFDHSEWRIASRQNHADFEFIIYTRRRS